MDNQQPSFIFLYEEGSTTRPREGRTLQVYNGSGSGVA